jgi:hypothetical protein
MPEKKPIPRMTKAEGRAFKERWRLANARAEEELHSTPADVKWKQFNTLLRMAQDLGWSEQLAQEDERVRERWAKIREAYRGKTG